MGLVLMIVFYCSIHMSHCLTFVCCVFALGVGVWHLGMLQFFMIVLNSSVHMSLMAVAFVCCCSL
jgi:hypothetical protein